MEKFVVDGGVPLTGTFIISGAKNVALKTCVSCLLTRQPVVIKNIPHIQDVFLMEQLLRELGARVEIKDHVAMLECKDLRVTSVPLSIGARMRTSSLVLGPLLARLGEAIIPNPGGCRIGARPIDRHIEALKLMGAEIKYDSDDGFFHAKASHLHGATIRFPKNTHTGTETLILAGVLAHGVTVLENAAEEVEVDDLINLLNVMGAKIHRISPRTIVIEGVRELHGAEYEIMSDRNEEVTFAIAAAITGGQIAVERSARNILYNFEELYCSAGGQVKHMGNNITQYSRKGEIKSTNIVTQPHPGFMTDWQAPWAVFMTQATGISTIHETIFESRFSYVGELEKMGAHIEFVDTRVENPQTYYNFNWSDHQGSTQLIKIYGPTKLHNAILDSHDLRAGASLLLAALAVPGQSEIYGIEQIDRGYESIDTKLRSLGARIDRISGERI